jgi:hypothetical protein
MEEFEMRRARPSGDVLRERARLNGRILRWVTLAVSGLVVFVLGREVYLAEWLIFWSGLFAVLGILVGSVGFVLDGLSRWELSGEQAMERTETRRVNSVSRAPAVRLARKRSANRITLSSWEFDPGEWNLIVSRLAAQEWRFNRELFEGIVPNLTRRGVWDGIRKDWIKQGHLYQDGRSWWVRPGVRRRLASPAPASVQAANWLMVHDDDEDDGGIISNQWPIDQ